MSAPAWMPLYVADYLADTGHLTMAEHGAYMLLIMHYWQNGGLPDDEVRLARICRASPKEWAGMRDTLADLFAVGWRHKRVDEEIEKTSETMDKRSTAGRTAGLASAAARRRNAQRSLNETRNDEATIVERPSTPSPPPIPRKEKEAAQQSSTPPRASRKAEIDEIQTRLREAAGLEQDPSPALLDLSPMLTLLSRGYDLERDILPVLKAAAASGKRGRTWRYYLPGIEAAKAGNDAIKAPPAGSGNGSKPAIDWDMAVRDYEKLGGEFFEGNGPGQWGYRRDLPPDVQARFDAADERLEEARKARFAAMQAAAA